MPAFEPACFAPFRAELKEAFNLFDIDDSGRVNPNDLMEAMTNLGFNAENNELLSEKDGVRLKVQCSEFDLCNLPFFLFFGLVAHLMILTRLVVAC